jgi:hypothetical protein
LAAVSDAFPKGSVQGLKAVKQFTLDASFDGGLIEVDLSDAGVAEADLQAPHGGRELRARGDTGHRHRRRHSGRRGDDALLGYPGRIEVPTSPIRLNVSLSGNALGLSWSGGQAPYTLQTRSALTGAWQNLLTTGATTVTVPLTNSAAFFRIGSN